MQSQERSIVHYFRLRPTNFPTIRISQLAMLYVENHNLFSQLMELKSKDDYYKLLTVETSEFWKTHYTFEKESKSRAKKLTKSFIDLLLINTIIPLRFVYQKEKGKFNLNELLEIIKSIAAEKNSIVSKFSDLKINSENAFDSQALIQLKNTYCIPQKCLQCAVGNCLLKH